MFLSVKYGDAESERNGCFFNSHDEPAFRALLAQHAALEEVQLWTSEDVRPDRVGERWLDTLMCKA